MRVFYTILNHDVDKQCNEEGDWSPQPCSNELIRALGKDKPKIDLHLQTRYFVVKIVDIRERQNPKIVFSHQP